MRLRRRYLDARLGFVMLACIVTVIYFAVGLSPARAAIYDTSGTVEIPSIGLNSDVTTLSLTSEGLQTPDTIVGSYTRGNKTLLIGHSTTVFQDLDDVKLGDIIYYNGEKYKVSTISVARKEDIIMSELLRPDEQESLVVMTCAGTLLEHGDATHRLMLDAVEI